MTNEHWLGPFLPRMTNKSIERSDHNLLWRAMTQRTPQPISLDAKDDQSDLGYSILHYGTAEMANFMDMTLMSRNELPSSQLK